MNSEPLTVGAGEDDYFAQARAAGMARADALRAQAAEGGMRFEAYLPPSLATWLLDKIADGSFVDPSEAVFVMLGEQQDLEPHADLREEILRRRLQAGMDDPHPGIPAEEAMATLKARLAETRPEPARWEGDLSAPGSASTA